MELTTALLHVFNAPDDKIVYDVGHQAYVHKMLTGRRRLMPTIRQTGGISGALGSCTCAGGEDVATVCVALPAPPKPLDCPV